MENYNKYTEETYKKTIETINKDFDEIIEHYSKDEHEKINAERAKQIEKAEDIYKMMMAEDNEKIIEEYEKKYKEEYEKKYNISYEHHNGWSEIIVVNPWTREFVNISK